MIYANKNIIKYKYDKRNKIYTYRLKYYVPTYNKVE